MSEGASFDILGPHFTNVKVVGTGGSGTVFSAVDCKSDTSVALKRLSLNGRIHCQRTLRELKVQTELEHENIVKILRIVDSEGKSLSSYAGAESFKDTDFVYAVQELFGTDLHRVLQQSNRLTEEYASLFLYQLLRGLKYIHSANVLHRDVKPSNLLLDTDNLLLKISDFGLSRVVDSNYDHHRYLSECTSTLWYKAPELLLNSKSYDNKVDLWGAGCVLAEMLLGKPLFEGRHEMEQIQLIFETIDVTEKDLVHFNDCLPEKLQKANSGITANPLRRKFEETGISIEALDLLEKLLAFNPNKRPSAEEALAHPFLLKFAFPSDEPLCLAPFHIEDEVDNFPENIMKDVVFDEIMSLVSVESSELEEIVIEKAEVNDKPEKEIMSLKEAMVTEDAPISLREFLSKSDDIERNSFNFDKDVWQQISLHSNREAIQTFAGAMKIQRSLKAPQQEKFKGPVSSRLSASILENILGKHFKENLNFTCKKNALAGHGPFGMCYL